MFILNGFLFKIVICIMRRFFFTQTFSLCDPIPLLTLITMERNLLLIKKNSVGFGFMFLENGTNEGL